MDGLVDGVTEARTDKQAYKKTQTERQTDGPAECDTKAAALVTRKFVEVDTSINDESDIQ